MLPPREDTRTPTRISSSHPSCDKNLHQRTRGQTDNGTDRCAEQYYADGRLTNPLLDAFSLPCTEILSDKERKGITEITCRHIRNCINLYSNCERRHYRCTETVDNSLYDQNSEVHDRLLQTGKTGQ